MKGVTSVSITSPALDAGTNVSGISSVVRSLSCSSDGSIRYNHIVVGSADRDTTTAGRIASSLRSVYEILRSEPRILHCNSAFNKKSIIRDTLLIASAKFSGKKVLLHMHGGFYLSNEAPFIWRIIIRIMMAVPDYVVFLSETEVKIFQKQYGLSRSGIRYINNGTPLPDSPHLSYSGNGLKVAFIGRLEMEKGIDIVLEAFRDRRLSNVDLVVAGNGSLRYLVDDCKSDNIRYLGALEPDQVSEVLARCDVLILPSRSGEGMPMAIIEAMSLGVVPIITPMSSIPEFVIDGENGLHLAQGCANAVVEKITELNSDPELLVRMKVSARRMAEEKFDARRMFQAAKEIYLRLSCNW